MYFEKKLVSSATLIDLAKAFDILCRKLLIKELFLYGISNNELKLIVSYLSDRIQMVVQGKDKSDFKCIDFGVSQGSVLGPFLFIIVMNDFASSIPYPSVLYVDDITFLIYSNILENLKKKENKIFTTA